MLNGRLAIASLLAVPVYCTVIKHNNLSTLNMITQERLPLISVNNIQSVRSLNDSEKYEDNPSENEGNIKIY